MDYDETTAPDALKGSYFVFGFSADHTSHGLVLCKVDDKGYLRVSMHPYEYPGYTEIADLEDKVLAFLQENSACPVYTTATEPQVLELLFGKYLSHHDVRDGQWYCFHPLTAERHARFENAGIEVIIYDNTLIHELRKSA